ncbi:MAG: bifunctional phosphopantothenoylcysteine decarboxylase/phosphopantothenate--cysteine ligase CoaBC [Bacteroidia bacterium]
MLEGKHILLGISGSIAAYKCAALTRLFVKAGAEVKIIMTSAATEFITPLTLSTLSKNPVHSSFVKNEQGEWTNHVDLALWADVFIIAPASANTLAKMANGICDNLLLATYLSAKCPVWFAPAMDLDMYLHPATKSNIQKLKDFGNVMIDAEVGELASGLYGNGRMAEPEKIFDKISNFFHQDLKFKNKTVLISAGPTYEAIDPVRFIGNHSSGKMGFALAEEFANQGANVILVSGPSKEKISQSKIQRINVQSAEQMFQEITSRFKETDIAIMSAAVADYTPVLKSDIKIKKQEETFTIELTKTKDILKHLGTIKDKQILVGFALETNNEEENALKKLHSKNLDFIVLNSLQHEGAGFGHSTNRISILKKSGEKLDFPLKTKEEVAKDIVEQVKEILND